MIYINICVSYNYVIQDGQMWYTELNNNAIYAVIKHVMTQRPARLRTVSLFMLRQLSWIHPQIERQVHGIAIVI